MMIIIFDVLMYRSLFDSIHERYEKNRSHIQPYIIIQFGISTFQRVHDENKYTAETFNFFLLPRTISSKNRHFLWQIRSLEFLTMYGFDFNKVYMHCIYIHYKYYFLLAIYFIDSKLTLFVIILISMI